MSRVYLVDDHAMVRDGLRAVLEAAGHEAVGESDEPTHALAELLRLAPDVALIDLNLGTRSGLELLAELQKRASPMRRLVLTMSAEPRQVAEALRLGADGYVLKGSPARELLSAIESVLGGGRYLGAAVADLLTDLALQILTGEAPVDPLAALSPRERQIIVMVVDGHSSAAIGQTLHLSPKTVDTYRSRLMSKIAVHDLPSLVRWAVRVGLVDAGT